MKAIAVFFGGRSVEHDVSLITGTLTLNSLDKEKFIPVPIYVHNSGEWFTGAPLFDVDTFNNLKTNKLNRVFIECGTNVLYEIKGKRIKRLYNIAAAINCLHGERGEDGSLSGFLQTCNIPLASPGLIPSSVCMDKSFTKIFLKGLSVSTLDCITIDSVRKVDDVLEQLKFPVIVKPNKLGSSVGVSVAKDQLQLEKAVNYALSFGKTAIIEECLSDFIEINCAAYMRSDGKIAVSECERPIGRTSVLYFSDKYENGEREFPALIDKSVSDKIKQTTEKIYSALDARGIIRIDYFVKDGQVLVNEINTVPGSLGYYFFTQTLKGFKNILSDQIALAEREFAIEQTFVKEYRTGILSGLGIKGAKRLKKT